MFMAIKNYLIACKGYIKVFKEKNKAAKNFFTKSDQLYKR